MDAGDLTLHRGTVQLVHACATAWTCIAFGDIWQIIIIIWWFIMVIFAALLTHICLLGFVFSEDEQTALEQFEGGPCAVIAPVQVRFAPT